MKGQESKGKWEGKNIPAFAIQLGQQGILSIGLDPVNII
jgi:hypothetical protein